MPRPSISGQRRPNMSTHSRVAGRQFESLPALRTRAGSGHGRWNGARRKRESDLADKRTIRPLEVDSVPEQRNPFEGIPRRSNGGLDRFSRYRADDLDRFTDATGRPMKSGAQQGFLRGQNGGECIQYSRDNRDVLTPRTTIIKSADIRFRPDRRAKRRPGQLSGLAIHVLNPDAAAPWLLT